MASSSHGGQTLIEFLLVTVVLLAVFGGIATATKAAINALGHAQFQKGGTYGHH